jgi:hypothetical protein
MKKIFLSIAILSTLLLFQACQINDPNNRNNYTPDNTPPAAPTGVQVLNGDNVVDLSWNRNRENDLAGYNIYWSTTYNGKYTLLNSSTTNAYTDNGATNGVLNYYAVTAYDQSGNESDLSKDVVYATPRPEGFNQAIDDYRTLPNTSGYQFATYSVVIDTLADVFAENYQGTHYLDVWGSDTYILDAGATTDIYDIPFAPTTGWSPTSDAIAIVGHTYVIWTWNNHYAKMRVKNIVGNRVVFDWAYQLVAGNTQLKIKAGGTVTTRGAFIKNYNRP